MEKKVLQMVFNTTGGSTSILSVNEPLETLTDAQVGAAMDSILTGGVFTSTTGDYASKKEAKLVTTTTSEYSL